MDGVHRLLISAYIIAAVYILFRYAFSVRRSKGKRVQAFLIAVGMFVPTVQGVVTQIIYPVILHRPEIPVTSTFMTFFSLATIISIRKYKLFNLSESVEVETVLANLKNIVFVISPKKQIIYMNPFAQQLFLGNRRNDEVVDIEVIFPDRAYYHSFASEVFEQALNGEPVTNYTTAFNTSTGKQIEVLLSAELIQNNKQIQGLLLVANDITELSKTVRELELSNNELERFAYVASHDLQEPLRKVSLFLQLLEARYKDKIDETADAYIHSAVSSAKQMRQLIRDLLEYSHIGATNVDVEAVNMNEVLDTVTKMLDKEIQETGAIIQYNTLPVLQNSIKTQMVQLIQNLLSNALKYRSDKNPQINISASEEGNFWRFAVADNGIGIDPEFHEKVFVIFRRLHNRKQYPGTGVGLSICKKIVEQHGGRITIDSKAGEGATFNFTISKSPNAKLSSDTAFTSGSTPGSFVD
jgi:PAS domain S-box-containing protein